jgi:hypothetical protein
MSDNEQPLPIIFDETYPLSLDTIKCKWIPDTRSIVTGYKIIVRDPSTNWDDPLNQEFEYNYGKDVSSAIINGLYPLTTFHFKKIVITENGEEEHSPITKKMPYPICCSKKFRDRRRIWMSEWIKQKTMKDLRDKWARRVAIHTKKKTTSQIEPGFWDEI